MSSPRILGLVLAAGAGTRMGGPKALLRTPDGAPWVHTASRMLRAAGCSDVLVALGASEALARELVSADAVVVSVPDWAEGLSATLRAGLAAAAESDADAVVITPVDTPDAPAAAAARVIAAAASPLAEALVRATYGGRPGHPVLIGRAHWAAVSASVEGDAGAGKYLRAHGALAVECADLWSGADIDSAPAR